MCPFSTLCLDVLNTAQIDGFSFYPTILITAVATPFTSKNNFYLLSFSLCCLLSDQYKGKRKTKTKRKGSSRGQQTQRTTANSRHLLRSTAKMGERPSFRPHNSYSKMNITYVSVLGENTAPLFCYVYYFCLPIPTMTHLY